MPETITCEHCNATLRLPEQFIGQEVRCPSCNNTFAAKLPAAAPPPAPGEQREEPVASIRPEPSADERPSRRQPRADDEDYPRRRSRYDEDDAYSLRRYANADRSGTVKILGILGVVFVGLGLCLGIPVLAIGFGLGLTAVIMGRNDLALMDKGERDPAGRSATKTGVLCGTISIVLFGVLLLLGCGFVILMITLDPQ
jgi:predicted Zn finger-like uncharacterized protein